MQKKQRSETHNSLATSQDNMARGVFVDQTQLGSPATVSLRPTRKRRLRTRKTLATLLLIFFCAPIGLSLWSSTHASALSNLSQSDWSGLVGSSPTDQYTSAEGLDASVPGQLTLSNSSANWCNAVDCTSSWTHRQALYIKNTGDEATGKKINVTIPYNADMNADFSDIRFTNQAGTVDLDYYLYTKTDSTSAEFVVSLPTLTASDVTTMYVYYGNSGASSISTSDVTNLYSDFADGNTVSGQWNYVAVDGDYTGGPAISGGEITYDGQAELRSAASFDRSIERTYEYDFKADLSAIDCGNSGGFTSNYMTSHLNFGFQAHAGCDGGGKYYQPESIGDDIIGGGGVFTNKNSVHGEYVRYRYVSHAGSGTDVYYSTNGGATFTKYDHPPTEETENSIFSIVNWGIYAPITIRNVVSYDSVDATTSLGVEELQGGKVGSLLSVAYDMGTSQTDYSNIDITSTGVGNFKIFPATSDSSTVNTDSDLRFCSSLENGGYMPDASCVSNRKRYATYLIQFASDSGNSLLVESIGFGYNQDGVAPTNATDLQMKTSSSGTTIDEGAWTSASSPYFSWTAGSDVGGSGIAGYCLYFGADSNGDPANSKGLITGSGDIDSGSSCTYATANPYFNESANKIGSLDNDQTYYFKVQALDNFGNISSTTLSGSLKYDNQQPDAGTIFNGPNAINSKIYRVTWINNGGFTDSGSGVAGLKYCVSMAIIGFSGCDAEDPNWYGANHTSGNLHDPSDVIPTSAGQLSTVPADADRLDDAIAGANTIRVALIDNAGNYRVVMDQQIFLITHVASDAPANLQVTPTSNTSNAFAFSWDVPGVLFGSPSNTNYCWTVNVSIAADGSNCNLTGLGITQLSTGPYATQQGTNTLYLATKDETGNFDNSKVTSIDFSAATTAPGIPQDLELSDVSTRATSTWKLALAWAAPSDLGSGVASYRILRSTDDVTFEEVGSTGASNTSFVDSGLDQVTYYYKVKACDNAANCGVPSSSQSRRPTGRFTEPAKLTADTDQPREKDITTRKATLFWFTDRESDSKVSIGTSPGQYFNEEIGNSTQTSNHNVNLTNLEPGTRYYYVAKWTDGDGNTGHSQEHSFVTLPAPSFSEVNPINVTVSSGTIRFTSIEASSVKLYYGKTEAFGAVKQIDTSMEESSYDIPLSSLDDGTKYFFRLNGLDPEGNEYNGNIYSFTTPARPKISNLQILTVDGESSSTKRITWTTNVPTTSTLTYSIVGGAAQDQTISTLVTAHEIIIRGLQDDSDYTLVASSHDAAGNSATSSSQTFHTALDTRPPKISNVEVETTVRGTGKEARGQVIVSWKTDELATSQVAFGQGENGALTSKTAKDDRLSLEHTMVVSDLPTSSIYQIQAISADKAENSALSDSQTAIVGRGSENVFTIIFTSLQKIFGIGS